MQEPERNFYLWDIKDTEAQRRLLCLLKLQARTGADQKLWRKLEGNDGLSRRERDALLAIVRRNVSDADDVRILDAAAPKNVPVSVRASLRLMPGYSPDDLNLRRFGIRKSADGGSPVLFDAVGAVLVQGEAETRAVFEAGLARLAPFLSGGTADARGQETGTWRYSFESGRWTRLSYAMRGAVRQVLKNPDEEDTEFLLRAVLDNPRPSLGEAMFLSCRDRLAAPDMGAEVKKGEKE